MRNVFFSKGQKARKLQLLAIKCHPLSLIDPEKLILSLLENAEGEEEGGGGAGGGKFT